MGMTFIEEIEAREAVKRNGPWIPASGGTELPFTARSGRKLQYLYQPSTGNHCYYDCQADIFLTDEEAAIELMMQWTD